MEKVVYVIFSRVKDTFNTLYVADCENTTDPGFFTQNPAFKCWIEKSGSEKLLYLAILPMFDSDSFQRKLVVSKIIARYQPVCNMLEMPDKKSDYVVKTRQEPNLESEKIHCPCCGSEMHIEKILEKSTVIKCSQCGLSDTRLNS